MKIANFEVDSISLERKLYMRVFIFLFHIYMTDIIISL